MPDTDDDQPMVPVGLIENTLTSGYWNRLNDRERVILTVMAYVDYQANPGPGSTEETIARYIGYTKAELRYGMAGLVRRGLVIREVLLINDKAVPTYRYNREA